MKQIKLDVKVEEANLILEALGNLPFIKVHELISKIHQQAGTQMAEQNNSAVAHDGVAKTIDSAQPETEE
ncbi:MAG: hypothetical protein Q3M30_17440 [Candidatus Electrothrix sp. Rat3]|nr:hypothetical protein [Candidatus Electrothrix gigas]MDU9050634.1 hypothetical protein [Candidatus Electrothrix rattekaaiensis]